MASYWNKYIEIMRIFACLINYVAVEKLYNKQSCLGLIWIMVKYFRKEVSNKTAFRLEHNIIYLFLCNGEEILSFAIALTAIHT